MKNIFFILNFCVPLFLFGQFSDPKPVSHIVLSSPSKIIPSDFDEDGDIDFVVQGEVGGPEGLAYIENDQDLNIFRRPQELTLWMNDFETLDFDDDGDLDFIYLSHGDLAWIENLNGSAAFSEPNILRTDIYQYEIGDEISVELFSKDYDSDGDSDILFFENISSTLSFVENIDNFSTVGSFESVIIPDAAQVLLEDFDGDQLIDLLVRRTDTGGIYWYKSNGIFGDLTNITAVFSNVSAENIAVYDADGDDDLDIFIAMNYFAIDDLAWVENLDGQASFSNPKYMGLPTIPNFFTIEDADDDGIKDLLVIDENSQPQFYKNVDNFENLILQQTTEFPLMTHFSQVDLNQDGAKDFVYWNEAYNEIGWLEKTTQAYEYEEKNLILDFVSIAASMQLADLTGSGTLDIVTGRDVSFTDDNNIRLLKSIPELESHFGHDILVRDADDIRHTLLIDVDNDSDLDLLAQHPDGGLGLYFNFDGQGTFTAPGTFMPELTSLFEFLAIDLDNDNQEDFVYVNSNRQAFWRKNNGNGTFGQANLLSTPQQELRDIPKFTDVDEDGDLDIFYVYRNVISNTEIDSLIWKNNNGQAVFETPQLIYESDLTPRNLAFGDLDDDGTTDLAFSMQTPFTSSLDSIVWLPNLNGDGNFASRKPVAKDLTYYSNIHIFDIDNDGDNDMLYGGGGGTLSKEIRWAENIDNGNEFLSHHLTDLSFLLYYLEVADYENDGDLDIFYAAGGNYPIAWLENETYIINNVEKEHENLLKINIQISPNPSSGKIWLNESNYPIKEVSVFDTKGILLFSVDNKIEEENLLIDLSSYPNGIYLIQGNTEKGDFLEKVIITK